MLPTNESTTSRLDGHDSHLPPTVDHATISPPAASLINEEQEQGDASTATGHPAAEVLAADRLHGYSAQAGESGHASTDAALLSDPAEAIELANLPAQPAEASSRTSHSQETPLSQPRPDSSTESQTNVPGKRELKRQYTYILREWWKELAAAVLVILLFICEVVLLVHYDRKDVDLHWPHGLTINSVLALITTFLENAMLFYTEACMGQLRWSWFNREQPLKELEILTNATKPLGALRLLLHKGQFRNPAAYGALLIIFIGISTFTQNVITELSHDQTQSVASVGTRVQINYTWNDESLWNQVPARAQLPASEMIGAITTGVYESLETDELAELMPDYWWCKGDTCRLGRYQSLAICSQCADISDTIRRTCSFGQECTDGSFYYTLEPHVALYLAVSPEGTPIGLFNLSSDTNDTFVDLNLASAAGPLIVRSHAISTDNVNGSAVALECAAWWCVRTYNASIDNGILDERVIGEWTNSFQYKRHVAEKITLHPEQCFINDTLTDDTNLCSFHVGYLTHAALQNFLTGTEATSHEPFLSGAVAYSTDGNSSSALKYTSPLTLDFASAYEGRQNASIDFQASFYSMAYYMTVNIRKTRSFHNQPLVFSYGVATRRIRIFSVRWPWLAYAAALVALSVIFLLATVYLTRRSKIWKSSIMPLCFTTFDDAERQRTGPVNTRPGMESIARSR